MGSVFAPTSGAAVSPRPLRARSCAGASELAGRGATGPRQLVDDDVARCPAPVAGSYQPRPHEDTFAYPLDDELVVYAGNSAQLHVLNATGAALWALLDGATTVATLAETLAATFALDESRALADTVELVERLRDAGLLAAD